jgi:hypothetical protein
VQERLTARKADAATEAVRPCQKACGLGRDCAAPLPMRQIPPGRQVPSSCLRYVPLVHGVSPTRPPLSWSPNRQDGGRRRG